MTNQKVNISRKLTTSEASGPITGRMRQHRVDQREDQGGQDHRSGLDELEEVAEAQLPALGHVERRPDERRLDQVPDDRGDGEKTNQPIENPNWNPGIAPSPAAGGQQGAEATEEGADEREHARRR